MREIRAFSEFFNNSDDVSIKFEWDVPPDGYPNYPLTYYFDLYFGPELLAYQTHNSTSVTLSPLPRNFTYLFVVRKKSEREGKREKKRSENREGEKGKEREREPHFVFLDTFRLLLINLSCALLITAKIMSVAVTLTFNICHSVSACHFPLFSTLFTCISAPCFNIVCIHAITMYNVLYVFRLMSVLYDSGECYFSI